VAKALLHTPKNTLNKSTVKPAPGLKVVYKKPEVSKKSKEAEKAEPKKNTGKPLSPLEQNKKDPKLPPKIGDGKTFIKHYTTENNDASPYLDHEGEGDSGMKKETEKPKLKLDTNDKNDKPQTQNVNPNESDDTVVPDHKITKDKNEDSQDVETKEPPIPKQSGQSTSIKPKETTIKKPGIAGKASMQPGVASAFGPASDTSSVLQSLQQTPASKLGPTFLQAKMVMESNLEKQKQEAKEKMPEVPEKEGSIYGGNIKGLKKKHIAVKSAASVKYKIGDDGGNTVIAEDVVVPQPYQYNLNTLSLLPDENTASEQVMAQAAQNQLHNVLIDTSDVPDDMGPVEHIDETGDADSGNIGREHAAQSLDVTTKKDEAAKEINNDFGENDIIPQPGSGKIKTKHKFKSLKSQKQKGLPLVTDNGTRELDLALTPQVDKQIGEQRALYDTGDSQYKEQSDAEYLKAETKIESESSKSKQSQFDANNEAVDTVNGERLEWKKQLDGAEASFQKEAKGASETQKSKVKVEVDKGNKDIKQHHKDAAAEAIQKKKDAEEEAKKEKEKKKKDSGGFFGWVRRKAAALVDALKSAFNFIVKKLRAAIKWVFDKFKKLVTFVLNTVRKLIVGLIKAFGEILKGIVDIALAAFPEIRDKVKSKIDGAVNTAVSAVNKAFDVFIKIVSAIIDFLAEVIDKLYGLMQSLVNGLLTVISMLISGDLMELFKRFGHIVDAIGGVSFDTIKQGGIEELLGVDLDKPLDPKELAVAADMGLLPEGAGDAGLPQAPWTPANVGVDGISSEEVSPEIQLQIAAMVQSGTTEQEIGNEANDPTRTMSSVMEDASSSGAASTTSAEKRDDGLTSMQRAEIKWGMMKKGLTKWWSDNWLYVVGGVVAAIAAFIAAEIFTGGAITAALPVIIPILEYVFAGIAIAQFGGYVVDFLDKSWNGYIKGGTKALSRGLGAALIELAMYLGFGVLKVAGKVAKTVVKGAISVGKQVGKAIIRGAKFLIEKGKVLFKGIVGKGLGKVAKNLEHLANKILEHVRFKKIRIRFEGGRFALEGYINPWVLLATGKVEFKAGKGKVGTMMDDGLVVGARKDPSGLVKELTNDPALGKELFELATKSGLSKNGPALINGLRNVGPKRLRSALKTLENLSERKIPGLDTLIDDLGKGGNKFRGADFVLNFFENNPSMLSSLQRLEYRVATGSGARVIDAVVDGVRFEFKNWEAFRPQTFLQQMLKDLQISGDFRWLFNDRIFGQGIKNVDDLLRIAESAVKASGDPRLISKIDDILDQIYVISLSTGKVL